MNDQEQDKNQLPASSNKPQIEQLLKLYELQLSRFDKRRSYEWKLNFVLWGALAYVVGQALRGQIPPGTVLNGYAAIAFLSVTALAYVFWSSGLHSANRLDKKYADDYRKNVILCLNGSTWEDLAEGGKTRQWIKVVFHWAVLVQLLVTLGMLILVLFVLWPALWW